MWITDSEVNKESSETKLPTPLHFRRQLCMVRSCHCQQTQIPASLTFMVWHRFGFLPQRSTCGRTYSFRQVSRNSVGIYDLRDHPVNNEVTRWVGFPFAKSFEMNLRVLPFLYWQIGSKQIGRDVPQRHDSGRNG
jgi:hypothetical protein